MAIVKQTPNQLILHNKRSNFPIRGLLFTVLFSCGALAFACYSAGVRELNCQRTPNESITCEKKQSRFFGLTYDKPVKVQEVTAAQLLEETRKDNDGDEYKVYQIILLNKARNSVPVTGFSREYEEKAGTVNQINMFISSNQPSFILYYDNRWIYLIASLFILVVAVLQIVGDLSSNFLVFDKTMNRLYRKSSITPFWLKPWLKIKKEEYPFKEIKSVSITEDKDSNGNTFYKAEIVFNSEKRLSLFKSYELTEVESICQPIQEFLHDALPDRFDSPR